MAKHGKRKTSNTIDIKLQNSVLAEEKARIEKLMYNAKLSSEKKKYLTEKICRQVDQDTKDRQEYMDIREDILNMYEGIADDEKKDPFTGCADVRTMLVAMTAELLHSRLFPLTYNPQLSYWVPQELSDIAQAEGVSKFMPWANRRCSFENFADDYTQTMILEGTTVTKIIWDEEWQWVTRKIPRIESVKRQLVAKIKSAMGYDTEVEYEDSDFKIEYEYIKLEHARPELISLDDVGFPVHSIPGADENKLDHIWHRTRPNLIDIRQKAHLGYFENATDLRDKIVTDYVGEGNLNEARMEAEGSRSSAEEVEIDEKKLEQIEWYGKVEIPGEGLIECIVWVEKRTKTFLGIMPLLHLSRKNRRPFVIAQFIRRMNRMYGKTVLEFILEIEKEVNSIHNQRLDAGTMSIVPPLFFTPNSGFSPQDVKLKPGICLPVDDINSVKWMQMPNNVLVSFQEERILMELVEKITSVGSYQSGQQSDVVKSGATARGTLAVIAQGEQRFQTLAKRLQSPISKIQRKLLESYQENIPPGMEKRVLGDDAKPIFPRGLSAEDLVGNFDLIHSVDATGGLKQVKIEMDDQLAAAMAENPIAQQFLMQNIGGAWELIAEPLRNRGKDPEKILGPKPQMPELQQDISQTIRKCISEIKQGRLPKEDTKVNPMQLLTALVAYKTTPEAMGLEPEKQALLELKIEKLRLTLATQMMKQNSMGAVAEGMKNERVGVEGQGPTQAGPAGAGIEPRVAGSPVEAAENEGERVVESGK